MTVPQLTKMFIHREPINEFIDNDKLMKIARRMKADTSIAEILHGKGFITDALHKAIEKRIDEIESINYERGII